MKGWEWETASGDSAGSGLSDSEDQARGAAEAWLQANPQATAVLGEVLLTDGATTLTAYWAPAGDQERSRRGPDGQITWEKVPALGPGAGG